MIAVGMAEYDPGNDSNVTEIFDRADHMMYEDKRELKLRLADYSSEKSVSIVTCN